MIMQIAVAAVGTVAFSLLFGVPRKYYRYCAVIGGSGWFLYCVAISFCSIAVSTFFATMLVVLLARIFAVWEKCPVTIFMIAGIFPIVPGADIYWTAYYFVTNQTIEATGRGYAALKTAVAIVLGIVCIFELPQKIFNRFENKKEQ